MKDDYDKIRLAYCKVCPHLNKTFYVCGKCGCYMVLKVKLKNAKCPVGKW